MVSRIVMACAMFVGAIGAFIVFVEFAGHAIFGRDHDDRLFGGLIAIAALAATLFFTGWGMGCIGL